MIKSAWERNISASSAEAYWTLNSEVPSSNPALISTRTHYL